MIIDLVFYISISIPIVTVFSVCTENGFPCAIAL
jgi:hypothetical protein